MTDDPKIEITKTADLSNCGRYRYRLERNARGPTLTKPRMVVIGLNPSRADGRDDDATVRVLLGYAIARAHRGFVIGNLFAWRDPRPRDLQRAHARGEDIFGPHNLDTLSELVAEAADTGVPVVCAWGSNFLTSDSSIVFRHGDIVRGLQYRADVHGVRLACFGINADGSPGHPLRRKLPPEPLPWGIGAIASAKRGGRG